VDANSRFFFQTANHFKPRAANLKSLRNREPIRTKPEFSQLTQPGWRAPVRHLFLARETLQKALGPLFRLSCLAAVQTFVVQTLPCIKGISPVWQLPSLTGRMGNEKS
jgi:hypothetical protein